MLERWSLKGTHPTIKQYLERDNRSSSVVLRVEVHGLMTGTASDLVMCSFDFMGPSRDARYD